MTNEETTAAHVPREGDVFRFTYSDDRRTRARVRNEDLHWCFDGQVVFRRGIYRDTYWGLERVGAEGRTFSEGELPNAGSVVFVCNLADVELIKPEEFPLYAEGDAFNLTHQHGCCRYFVKRRGALKSKDLMHASLDRRVWKAHEAVAVACRGLEQAVADRERGRMEIANGIEPPRW